MRARSKPFEFHLRVCAFARNFRTVDQEAPR